jgi:hypothetical protein
MLRIFLFGLAKRRKQPERFQQGNRLDASLVSARILTEYSLAGLAVNNACHYEAATKRTRTETLLPENIYRLVERFVVAGEIPYAPVKPPNRLFVLVNIREKRFTRLLSKDLARIADIDLPVAMTFIGPRGPKTLSELRTILHSRHG